MEISSRPEQPSSERVSLQLPSERVPLRRLRALERLPEDQRWREHPPLPVQVAEVHQPRVRFRLSGSASAGSASVAGSSAAAGGSTVVAPPATSVAATAGVSAGGNGAHRRAAATVRTVKRRWGAAVCEAAAVRVRDDGATSRSRDNAGQSIDSIGGQSVVGSGFESERPAAGFVSSVGATNSSWRSTSSRPAVDTAGPSG